MKPGAQTKNKQRGAQLRLRASVKVREVMIIAEKEGLLRGEALVVHGRMPKALVATAKKQTGPRF